MGTIRVVTPDKKNKIVIPKTQLQDYIAQGFIRLEHWAQQEVEKVEREWLASPECIAHKKAEKNAEIESSYQDAVAASITMAQDSPSPLDISVQAALYASEDLWGMEWIMNQYAQRKALLLTQVKDAETIEELQAIDTHFAVL